MGPVKSRRFWIGRIESEWKRRTVLWVSGVRRAGKTVLCRTLADVEYFDCELPRVRRLMEDPEEFLRCLKGRRVVLDEIHRLGDPSQLLKIAADHYPHVRIVATGPSTLGASRKFRDTLTGRKAEVWLTPLILPDLDDFGSPDMGRRVLRGGLPPFFLARSLPEREYQEWVDAYWAKDIQELFRLERRQSFQKFFELLMAQSGGIFEANRFSRACQISAGTVSNYLSVLEATFVVHVLRPFSTHRPTEIVSAPKVYGFDTGFVCYHRGWHDLRREDMGALWDHIVLNELHGRLQTRDIRYWRDKRGHEVDFVIAPRGGSPTAIECKMTASDFDSTGIKAFRRQYPEGKNYAVAHDVDRGFRKTYDEAEVEFISLPRLIEALSVASPDVEVLPPVAKRIRRGGGGKGHGNAR